MTKVESIKRYAELANITEAEARARIKLYEDVLNEGLQNDHHVAVGDMGFMKLGYRKARTGRNPQKPKEVLNIEESVGVSFKASKGLNDFIRTPEIIAKAKSLAKPAKTNAAE